MKPKRQSSGSAWTAVPLAKAAMVNPPEALPPGDHGDPMVPLYEMAEIDEFAGTLRSPAMVPLRSCRSGRTRFRNGDVLFAKITPCVQNGKCALAEAIPGDLGFGSSELYVLRAGRSLLPEYLFYFLRQKTVVQAAVDSFSGTSGRQRVPPQFWERLSLPLPPLPVQERIVQILQKADEIRRKRKQALDLVDKILPAIFLEMFGDPATNPKGWPTVSLGEILALIRNGTTADQNVEGRGYPVTRIETISEGVINPKKVRCVELDSVQFEKWRLQPGDILFSHINSVDHIGKVAMYSGEPPGLVHGMNLLLLRTDPGKCLPIYLFVFLRLLPVRKKIQMMARQAVNQASINQRQLRDLHIMLPPLRFQEKLAMAVEQYESTLSHLALIEEEGQIIFENLLCRAFTGELTAEWEAANAQQIAAAQRLYEALPRLALLALLAEAVLRNRSSLLLTALMKYVFLLQMEANGRRRFYHFVPYHYGPFARELYADLEQLCQEGLITIDQDTEEDKTRIAIADSARVQQALGELPEDLRADIAAILDQYGQLEHNRLLKTVYEKYPAYVRKSRLLKSARKPSKRFGRSS